MKKIFSIIIIVLGVGAVIYLIFHGLKSSDPNIDGTLSTTSTNGELVAGEQDITTKINQQFVESLSGIKGVTLDRKIFKDKDFNSLVDYTSVLVPENNAGRSNPFAPIGVDAIPTLMTETSATVATGASGAEMGEVKPDYQSKGTKR